MSREEFEAIQRWIAANQEIGRIVERHLQEHADDYKFNLPPIGHEDYESDYWKKKNAQLENFYAGGL